MNRNSGGVLAILIVASFLAGSSGSRPASYQQGGGGGYGAGGTTTHGKKPTNSGGSTHPNKSKAPEWGVPPDPRCFLIRAIAEFYGSQDPVRSGQFYDAYEDVPEGCDPQKPNGVTPTTWGVPQAAAKKLPPVRFVIATVPNPVRTHLSLFFDRSVDAIQQGAQSAGYFFSRARMPWDPGEHGAFDDLDTKLAWNHYQVEQEKLPGVMIFRKISPNPQELKDKKPEELTEADRKRLEDSEDLFVWIVGETPTGGIDKDQFDNALQIMRGITSAPSFSSPEDQPALSILGPMFSGSLPSLHDLLRHLSTGSIKFASGKELKTAVVHSGSVESALWTDWFKKVQNDAGFTTLLESDTYAECHFLRYVRHLKFSLSEVAELSEDETAFGASASSAPISRALCGLDRRGGDQDDIVRVRFPREISQLRAAYQSELSQVPESATGGKQAPRTTLPYNWQDRGSDEDTVPTYAHAQYPLSQESVMLTITTALHTHHSRFVLLKATDPLDKLFLVRFLRKMYPQGRIVTFGSDLLYPREVEDDLLHGIMAITPYSLIPRADDQVAIPHCQVGAPHTDRIFPSHESAGEYNAMLSLLPPLPPCLSGDGPTGRISPGPCPPGGGPSRRISSGPYTEYGWPAMGGNDRPTWKDPLSPALWLTVLGRDAYWPLDLLDVHPPEVPPETSPEKRPEAPCSHLPAMAFVPPEKPFEEPFLPSLPPSWLLLNGLAGVLCFTLGYPLWRGTLLSSSEVAAHFAPVGGKQHNRLLSLLCFLALLVVALVTFPWGWWLGLRWLCSKWIFRFVIIVFWTSLGGFLGYRPVKREGDEWLLRVYSAALIGLSVVAVGIWYLSDQHVSEANPFFLRFISVTSGVSLLPCALLVAGAGLWWGWHSLQGMASLDDRRARLPEAKHHPGWSLGPSYLTDEGNELLRNVLSPGYLADVRLYAPGLLAGAVLCASLIGSRTNWLHPVQTLEVWPVDWLYAGAHLLIALVLVTELARLRTCWTELRQQLRTLDRLPLRRAFQELKGFSWKWMWSLGGSLEASSRQTSYRALNRAVEAKQHLSNAYGESGAPGGPGDPEVKMAELLGQVRQEGQSHLKWDFEWTKNLICAFAEWQERFAAMCGEELDRLMAGWKSEDDTSLFNDVDPKSKGPDENVPEFTRKREQFVALVYVNFIVTVMLRMRTIIVTIAGLYVFLLLSISFYPIEPMVILRPVVIVLFFVVVGVVGVVYGQMHKDAILSRLTDTNPGELGTDFYLKMGGFVVLPLVSLLVSQFPDVNNFLFSWLQPAMQSLNHRAVPRERRSS